MGVERICVSTPALNIIQRITWPGSTADYAYQIYPNMLCCVIYSILSIYFYISGLAQMAELSKLLPVTAR